MYDIIEGVVDQEGNSVNVRSVSGDGTRVFWTDRFGQGGYGTLSSGIVTTITTEFHGADESGIRFGQISTDGNYYCFTSFDFNSGNSRSAIVNIATEERIPVDAIIESA